jgi:hypothetical protein
VSANARPRRRVYLVPVIFSTLTRPNYSRKVVSSEFSAVLIKDSKMSWSRFRLRTKKNNCYRAQLNFTGTRSRKLPIYAHNIRFIIITHKRSAAHIYGIEKLLGCTVLEGRVSLVCPFWEFGTLSDAFSSGAADQFSMLIRVRLKVLTELCLALHTKIC